LEYYKCGNAKCKILFLLAVLIVAIYIAVSADKAFSSLTVDSQPTVFNAKDLLPQLDSRYAYMHGGKDINNAQIICLPHVIDVREITDEHFGDIFLYLTSLQQ